MKYTLGFSPCPNDTFIFDALVNGRLNTGGLDFEVVMEDVQTLNERALGGNIDFTKISYGALPMIAHNYVVLNAGSALGMGVGPLLISSIPVPDAAVKQCTIAIPGRNTSAHVLFSLAFPEATHKVFLRYDEIEDFVLGNHGTLENIREVKLGVIIHENRFTYQNKGLVKQTDLGHFWEEETGSPVPLGGIVAKRTIPLPVIRRVDALIRESLLRSFEHSGDLSPFIRQHAMEMSPQVMRQHIDLYVNEFSVDLGEKGRQAIRKFVEVHSTINKIPVDESTLFLS